MDDFNLTYVRGLIQQVVSKLALDLSDLTVLTEAGSGWFLFTPLICLEAGCQNVKVWVSDTAYGTAEQISSQLVEVCQQLEFSCERLDIAKNTRPAAHIAQADIVTNLGHVRPLDAGFVRQMKPGSVISTMSEAWELRPGDIDLLACAAAGVAVDGVWENFPTLRIFDFVGPLAAKLCFEGGAELFQDNILVISGDPFGIVVSNYLRSMGAAKVDLESPELVSPDLASQYDLCVLCDYIGESSPFTKHRLGQNLNCKVVHLAGELDFQACVAAGLQVYPGCNGFRFRMTRTLAHLGPRPVLSLHAAGLKVGENRCRGIESSLNQVVL